MQVQSLKRQFKAKISGNELILDDPNPAFSAEEVLRYYTNLYPELTNATVTAPVTNPTTITYEFKSTVGTKG